MSRRNRLEHLSSLREEIAALLVVKCHMSHERVVRAADSVLPVVCHFPEDNYQRIGLCSPEVRTQRLGCSHTMARIKLERAINELDLEAESTNETASDSSNELSFLDNEIHLLDHRKGEGETALAGIVTEAYNTEDLTRNCEKRRKAEKKIREMEELHDEYVARLGVLRDRVVTELDRLIERLV